MSEIVHIENLEKTYVSSGETLTVLKALDLSVEAGSKTVITGESGCGKSTLLNIIGGIDSATSGIVRAGGWDLTALDEDDQAEYRSHFLGFVFQFHYLLKDFTALENVMLPALIAGRTKKEIKEKALSLLEDVKLAERKNHFPSQLSGGERQRVAVARSLINSPKIIFADEPTGNLDPANAETVQNLLFSVVDKHKKTLVLVTHDQNIASMTDISYKLYKGNLEEV